MAAAAILKSRKITKFWPQLKWFLSNKAGFGVLHLEKIIRTCATAWFFEQPVSVFQILGSKSFFSQLSRIKFVLLYYSCDIFWLIQ